MTALVTATLLSISPTTHDHLAAFADLTLPAGAPPLTDRSPRARLAAIHALHALGGLDDDATEFRWFSPSLAWESELGHARRLAATVRECPRLADGEWIPPREWMAAEAAAYSATAAAWRRRAEEYRGRAEWEPDRSETLHGWARWMDAQADRYAAESCRLHSWAGTSWQRPRRVVLAEAREWMGPAAWDARRWPGE